MSKKKKSKKRDAKRTSGSSARSKPGLADRGRATRANPISLFAQSLSDEPMETGRYLVTTLEEEKDSADRVFKSLKNQLGVKRLSRSSERGKADLANDASALLLESLGIFVLDLDPDQAARARELAVAERSRVLKKDSFVIEPEYFCQHAGRDESDLSSMESRQHSMEYLQGYRDAIDQFLNVPMIDEPEADPGRDAAAERVPRRVTDSRLKSRARDGSATWGIDEVDVLDCPFSGDGIRVGVVDSGLDMSHPDFQGRVVSSISYLGGSAQDDHGHGTHCAGTLCGKENSTKRYGVARKAEICIAKVLGRDGTGKEADVICGIDWAVNQGCRVISVSIERGVDTCKLYYSAAYEAAGQRAAARNAVVFAAAGNRSDRRIRWYRPVSAPANTPSIWGVGAIREDRGMAYFSNRAACRYGEVNFVGPGNNVFSADLGPHRFRKRSGTSMATPHVAGIAALLLERDPGLTPEVLYYQMKALCRTHPRLDTRDFGNGLAQAPN